jgi:hypothetical protein
MDLKVTKKENNSGILYQQHYEVELNQKGNTYNFGLMIEFRGIDYQYYIKNLPEELKDLEEKITKKIIKMHDKDIIKF